MRIKQELLERDSGLEFQKAVTSRVDACSGIIHVRTKEIQRALVTCRKAALSEGSSYMEWDVVRGFTEYVVGDYRNSLKKGTKPMAQFGQALNDILFNQMDQMTRDSTTFQYVVFNDPAAFWDSPGALPLMRLAAYILPQTCVRFIMVTGDQPPPASLADLMSGIRLQPPGFTELSDVAKTLFQQTEGVKVTGGGDEENLRALCFSGAGMSVSSFEDTLSLAISENHNKGVVDIEDLIRDVALGKTEIVNKNDLLELYPKESIENVGGMENLKEWIGFRANCYSDEAAEFGIEPPKGMVFVGPPGTGKSLAAKAVASVLRVPLVRLDFGRVFNALVGSSEERIREALAMCEHMAPVVLFVDEIDKGLGGIGGGGSDSGTSSRVLGTFLSWLNDCTAPVFTMVTANNIQALPPELMRRGRFDAIFSTGMPTTEERLEVLKIHLRKRGWSPEDFDKRHLNLVADAARGYVPAEIEAAVKDGLILAFNRSEDFEHTHMIEALKAMVPLSKAYAEQIQMMTLWAQNNATPASKRYEGSDDGKVSKLSEGRRIRPKKKD